MKFIGIISTFSALIYLASFIILKSIESLFHISTETHSLILAILTLMPLLLIASMITAQKKKLSFIKIPYIMGAIWMVLLTYLFLSSFAIALGNLLGTSEFFLKEIASVLGLSSFIVTLAGIWNARTIRTTTYNIPTPHEQLKNKKVVIVSDLHLGVVRSLSFCKRVVAKINEEKPDAVFIAGDIIDGPLFDIPVSLAPLAYIRAPFGVYAIPGNHEYYSLEKEIYFQEIQKYAKLLRNEKIDFMGIHLVGLEHVDQESVIDFKKRIEFLSSEYAQSIVLLHDPKNAHVLQSKGTFLSLSGHTHKGQFWPFSLVVKALYKKYTYGLVQKENSTHITTSGVGTALSPVRIGSKSEIIVVEFA